jgi:predicted transcriptional regulator
MVPDMGDTPISHLPAHRLLRLMRSMGVSQADIALACEVSQGTVSRTIHRDPRVATGTRSRIWDRLEKELGT